MSEIVKETFVDWSNERDHKFIPLRARAIFFNNLFGINFTAEAYGDCLKKYGFVRKKK